MTLISNTFQIVMAVFDVAQHVINNAGGFISGSTAIDSAGLATLEATLNAMEIGPLLGLWLQSLIVQISMRVMGFLIMICVGIYAVLVQGVAFTDDIIGSIWGVMGYTVLLCFTLFKTGSLAKSVFSAH